MIVPAHEATRLICAKSHAPNLGSIVPSHDRTDSEILIAQAFSRVLSDSGVARFVVPPAVKSFVSAGVFVSRETAFVAAERVGKNRSRHASKKGRRETHFARSLCRSRE